MADVFSNGIFKYAADGTEITAAGGGPFIEIDLPGINPGETRPNAPSGLAFDEDGNLLVAVLGPTNPFDDGESHGALLRMSASDGSLLQELGIDLPPLSNLALISIPVLGDLNLDGEVNGLDVDPFVDVLLNGPFQVEADMNKDGEVNGLDVDPFVAAVVGGARMAVPEPHGTAIGLGRGADAARRWRNAATDLTRLSQRSAILNNRLVNRPIRYPSKRAWIMDKAISVRQLSAKEPLHRFHAGRTTRCHRDHWGVGFTVVAGSASGAGGCPADEMCEQSPPDCHCDAPFP